MADRLMAVGGERAWWPAELPVEMDGGGEGEDSGGEAADEACGGLGEVLLEPQLRFERVDDRLDPLADTPDRGDCSLWLVASTRAQQRPAERGDGSLELGAGEAFVGDHELTQGRLALEQREHGLTFGCVRWDEVEVTDAAVGAAPKDKPHSPVEAGVGGRVAKPAPGRELGAVRCLHALPAGKRCRIDVAERVVEAGQFVGDRTPEGDELGRQLAATFVVARLRGQDREQVGESASGGREEAASLGCPSSICATIRQSSSLSVIRCG